MSNRIETQSKWEMAQIETKTNNKATTNTNPMDSECEYLWCMWLIIIDRTDEELKRTTITITIRTTTTTTKIINYYTSFNDANLIILLLCVYITGI